MIMRRTARKKMRRTRLRAMKMVGEACVRVCIAITDKTESKVVGEACVRVCSTITDKTEGNKNGM